MIEAIKNMSAEQWTINVILPIAVGVILIILAAVIPKLPIFVKQAGIWLWDTLMMGWVTLAWKLRGLFTSKEEKAKQAELMARIRNSIEHQSDWNNARMHAFTDRLKEGFRIPRL